MMETNKCNHETNMNNDLGLIKICIKCGGYIIVPSKKNKSMESPMLNFYKSVIKKVEEKHFMKCGVCGEKFDKRELGEVFKHEHKDLPKSEVKGRNIDDLN